eukprot:5539626-Amphidinium_carterae.1
MLASMQLPSASSAQARSSTDGCEQPPVVATATTQPIVVPSGSVPLVPHEELMDFVPKSALPPAAEDEDVESGSRVVFLREIMRLQDEVEIFKFLVAQNLIDVDKKCPNCDVALPGRAVKQPRCAGVFLRCPIKGCQKYVHVTLDQWFWVPKVPLYDQTVILWSLANNVPWSKVENITGVKHRTLLRVSWQWRQMISVYTRLKQKEIVMTPRTGELVAQVEVDEGTFGLSNHDDSLEPGDDMCWIQAVGLIQRGRSSNLVLYRRATEKATSKRKPNYGGCPPPLTRLEYETMRSRHLPPTSRIVMHSDGARAYGKCTTAAGSEQQVLVSKVTHTGPNPEFTGVRMIEMPVPAEDAQNPNHWQFLVRAGTQGMDGTWRWLKQRTCHIHRQDENEERMWDSIRVAQWHHWQSQRQNKLTCVAETMSYLRRMLPDGLPEER